MGRTYWTGPPKWRCSNCGRVNTMRKRPAPGRSVRKRCSGCDQYTEVTREKRNYRVVAVLVAGVVATGLFGPAALVVALAVAALMVTDVGGYLRSTGADQRGGAHAPSGVPETVYHNDAWKRAKLGVKLPVALFGVALASVVVADRFGLEGTPAENVVTGVVWLWLLSMGVGAVLFVVSASRDKRVLHEATGRGTPRHPIVVGILVYVTGGAYALFYLVARSGKYAVDDRESDPPDDEGTARGRES